MINELCSSKMLLSRANYKKPGRKKEKEPTSTGKVAQRLRPAIEGKKKVLERLGASDERNVLLEFRELFPRSLLDQRVQLPK